MRRREGAGGGTDEEAVHEALDDVRASLQELRAFEAIRRQAGLWAEHEVDHNAEERATAQLLSLAAQRPHGVDCRLKSSAGAAYW